MTERPILFSGPMVRAILDGRKTQTRRVIAPQPEHGVYVCPYCTSGWALNDSAGGCTCRNASKRNYGHPGDRLWVKETWQSAAAMNICHKADDYIVYRATDPDWETMEGWKWRPSIYMPRWASRITLEVVSVRVERVQEIGKNGQKARDVLSEGITEKEINREREWFHPDDAPAIAFGRLWDSINAKRGYGWEQNPWVWVIEFQRVTQ